MPLPADMSDPEDRLTATMKSSSPSANTGSRPERENKLEDTRSHSKRDNMDEEDRGRNSSHQRRRDSRSPVSDGNKQKSRRKDTGFKWKEKHRDDYDRRDTKRDEGLRRGYKDQYRPKTRSRSRSRSPRRHSGRDYGDRERRHDRRERDGKENVGVEAKKVTKPAQAAQQQNYILVYVNDRLGTKTAIPCFATDTIKNFKAFVAAKIGRQPHEILIKRQGERPFKDILTLQDYGVSNNVQLDLEVDTGD